MSSIWWSVEGDGSKAVEEVAKLGGNRLESSNGGENVDGFGSGLMTAPVSVLEGSGGGPWDWVNVVRWVDGRRIEGGVTVGRTDGVETVGEDVDWRIGGRAAADAAVGWAAGSEDVDGGRSIPSVLGGDGVAGEALETVGVGAPKVGEPKRSGSEVVGSEVGGSWARISANGGTRELGASVGWTSAWAGETSISDATSGLAMGCPVVGFG